MAGKANAPNWKKIKAEFIRGGISQQKLADKYGVHRSTLQGRMQREGWQQLREEASAKTGQKLVEKTADKEAELLAELSTMQAKAAKTLYQKLLDSIMKYPDGAGTRTVRETVDVKEVKMDDGTVKKFPLRSSFTSDIEAAARTIATLGKLFGLDAGSELDKRRLELQYNPFGGEEPEDDGFLDALSKESAEAWQIEDVPANVNDRMEESGDEGGEG